MANQNDQVLLHLKQHGSITSKEAIDRYGITRLSARIHDLRQDGHHIDDEFIKVPNRQGEEVNVKQYELIREPQTTLF